MRFKFYIGFVFAIFMISVVVYANPTEMTVIESTSKIYGEAVGIYEETDEFQCEGVLLSETTQISEDIYEYLTRELRNMSEKIDLSAYNFSINKVEELSNVYVNNLRMNADLYYVSFSYKYCYNSKGKITSVTPNYIVTDKDEIAATVKQIEDEIAVFLSDIDDSMSDLEKILLLYEKTILHSEYDHTLQKYTAKDLFLDCETVCNGYASAMYILAERAGIRADFVVSAEMDHIWNAFYIDGSWYHADATWDDTTVHSISQVNHKYFLKSNEWMLTTGKHYDFTEIENDSTKYDDAFWNDAESPITALAGHMFYIDEASNCYANISVFNLHTGETSQIYKFENLWYTSSDKSGYWGGTFSGLAHFDGRLYVNNETQVLSFKPDGSDVRVEYTLEEADKYSIYGCHELNGEFYISFGLKSNPISNLQTQKITLESDDRNKTHVIDAFSTADTSYISVYNPEKYKCHAILYKMESNKLTEIDVIYIDGDVHGTYKTDFDSGFEIVIIDEHMSPLMKKVIFQ